jgi:iron only hydrogenase large subunit-like protein
MDGLIGLLVDDLFVYMFRLFFKQDFYHSKQDLQEVDLVLSTAELWQLLEQQAWLSAQSNKSSTKSQVTPPECETGSTLSKKLRRDPAANCSVVVDVDAMDIEGEAVTEYPGQFQHILDFLQSVEMDAMCGRDEIEKLFRCVSQSAEYILSAAESNAGSGAYTDYLFKSAAETLFGVSLWDRQLQYAEGRNSDYAELDIADYLSSSTSTSSTAIQAGIKLKFARAYGFRNIQSLLMKMKRGVADVDLVEISACPSGCNNGGGQLKAVSSMVALASSGAIPPRTETTMESKERVRRVEHAFHSMLRFRRPEDSPLVQFLYHHKRLHSPSSKSAHQLLHTHFHSVPKLETIAPLAVKW